MIRNLLRVSLFLLAMSQVACEIASNNSIGNGNTTNTNIASLGTTAGGTTTPLGVPVSATTPPTSNGLFPVITNSALPTTIGTSGASPEKIEIGVAKIADDKSIQEHAAYVRESLEAIGGSPSPSVAPAPTFASSTVVEPPNHAIGTAAATAPPPAAGVRRPASVAQPNLPPSIPTLAGGTAGIAR